MPTGYTAPIEEREVSFEEYVWRCARAFGALVTMRDDGFEAPVPEEFKVAPYYDEWIERSRAEVERLREMTPEEAEAAAGEDHEARLAEYQRSAAKGALLRSRYATLRAQAEEWTPPTPDHEGLKRFMVEQIDISTRGGLGPFGAPPVRKTGEAWLAEHLSSAEEMLARNERAKAEEEARVAGRNRWVAALRSSVSPSKPSSPEPQP